MLPFISPYWIWYLIDKEQVTSLVSVTFSTTPIAILFLAIFAESKVNVPVLTPAEIAATVPLAQTAPAYKSPWFVDVSSVYDIIWKFIVTSPLADARNLTSSIVIALCIYHI